MVKVDLYLSRPMRVALIKILCNLYDTTVKKRQIQADIFIACHQFLDVGEFVPKNI